jgi:hypothetical protein
MKSKEQPKSWNICQTCAEKRGWKLDGDEGITVMEGKCPECGKKAMLIPNRDFIKNGKKKVWI